MKYCVNCEMPIVDAFKTAYGDWLCEDCWDDYICTDAGLVEYMICICRGDSPVEEFDADFLGRVTTSWKINCSMLDLTPNEITEIETTAQELGLL